MGSTAEESAKGRRIALRAHKTRRINIGTHYLSQSSIHPSSLRLLVAPVTPQSHRITHHDSANRPTRMEAAVDFTLWRRDTATRSAAVASPALLTSRRDMCDIVVV
ncbi:hypothetical protein MVEN_00267300 [Mycena venus]|uniref:Uncharacterized protein n=1 Tax=Mycena venus TaxID=2733690 RepID=A0A8H7DCJ1_9AGAR|nr:hypothetical protein MVEN_00267300 [Mycena venus]